MKALIVGYGYMGQIRHRVADDVPGLDVTGICDPRFSPDSPGEGPSRWRDHREAIEQLVPDVVFVCTPNKFTPEVCISALDAGCHVFCEKPPGRTLADVQRIIDAESRAGRSKLVFGFNHRYHPAIQKAKSVVDAGRMGRVLWLRGIYGKSGGPASDFVRSWRNDPEVSGGGILLDQGIHMLDLFGFFCGEFTQVMGLLSTRYWPVPVEDNAMLLLRSRRGEIASLHSSSTLWRHTFNLDIGLESGYLRAEGFLSQSGTYGKERLTIGRKPDSSELIGSPREETEYFDEDRSWLYQVLHLVDCIERDLPVTEGSSADAFKVMEIIDRVYREQQARESLESFLP